MKLLQNEQNFELLELDDQEKEIEEDDENTALNAEDEFTPSGFNETDVNKRIEALERYYQVMGLF